MLIFYSWFEKNTKQRRLYFGSVIERHCWHWQKCTALSFLRFALENFVLHFAAVLRLQQASEVLEGHLDRPDHWTCLITPHKQWCKRYLNIWKHVTVEYVMLLRLFMLLGYCLLAADGRSSCCWRRCKKPVDCLVSRVCCCKILQDIGEAAMDRMLMILCMLYVWNVTLHTCLFKIDISRPIALDGTLMMAAVLAFCKPFPIDYINKISEAETKRVPNRYTSSALCNHPMQHTHVTLSRSYSYWRWPEMYMSRGIRRKRSQTASSGTTRGIIWVSYGYHHIRLSYSYIIMCDSRFLAGVPAAACPWLSKPGGRIENWSHTRRRLWREHLNIWSSDVKCVQGLFVYSWSFPYSIIFIWFYLRVVFEAFAAGL